MEYRTLGRTGVQVSALCMGTVPFGNVDAETSADMFKRCRDAGINFFDSANVYNGGRSEEMLGRLMAGCRDALVITSKVRYAMGPGVNDQGLSRRHIMQQVEASLKRLGTDWLDIYFVHGFDDRTPIDETLRALDDLVHQGKTRYLGVSNWAAWQVAKALGISAARNLARFECIQPMYNLVKRQAEVELLPLAASEQLGVMTYSPLGGGLLSGKYGVDRRPERGRLVENSMYRARYGNPVYFEIADRFAAHARGRGVHPATLALAWVMSHPAVTAPIIGARDMAQLETALDALTVPMTPEWRAEISALSIEPPPATDRSEEQRGVFYQGATEKE